MSIDGGNMKEIKDNLLKVFLGLTILIYIALSAIRPYDGIISNISTTISISIALYFIYSHFIWKVNPLHKSILLSKRYVGKLISDYDGSELDVKVEIRQSLFHVRVFLITNESKSSTLTSDIIEENGEKYLVYYFINNPQAIHKYKSPVHYGLCRLSMQNTNELCGQYFTDRKTRGDITLSSQ